MASPTKKRNPDLMLKGETVFARRAISPEVRKLLEFLKTSGVLKDYLIRHEPGKKGLSVGSYSPNKNIIVALSGGQNEGDSAVMHEVTHNLSAKGKGRTQRVKELFSQLNKQMFFRLGGTKWTEDVVMPKHWVEGKMEQPLTDRFIGLSVPPSGYNRFTRLAQNASERNKTVVRRAIPKGVTWSGLTSISEKTQQPARAAEEALAYAISQPGLGGTQEDRAKMAGMFLLNYGVPDTVVFPLVRRLSKMQPFDSYWSGGYFELMQLERELSKQLGLRNN